MAPSFPSTLTYLKEFLWSLLCSFFLVYCFLISLLNFVILWDGFIHFGFFRSIVVRLPSSNASNNTSTNKEGTPESGVRYTGRPPEPSVTSLWASGVVPRNDDRSTPTPAESRDAYALPFNRSIPERSTIQHVPTGRARERLEGPTAGARLVRHPGTHSIATQSIRIRGRSPSHVDLLADGRDSAVTPRPNSPDDLSISSVASSISTLGQNGQTDYDDEDPSGFGQNTIRHARRQSNTLGSPNQQPTARHFSMRPPSTRDNGGAHVSGTGALNNFFRTLTTRISRRYVGFVRFRE